MMKRIIQLILAIFIALPAVSQTVELVGPPDPQKPGQVSVSVDLDGFTSVIGSVQLYILYDTDLLTYKAFANPACGMPPAIGVHDWGLELSWFLQDGCIIQGEFIELKFDYEGGFDAELTFHESSEISGGESGFPGINWVGTSIIADTGDPDGTISLNHGVWVPAVPGDPVGLPVYIDGFEVNEAYGFDLQVQFNPDSLVFDSPSENTLGFTVNEVDGVIHLEKTDGLYPIAFDEDPVIILNFQYLGGLAEVAFKPGSFVLGNGGQMLAVDFVSSGVNDNVTNIGQLAIEKVYSGGITTPGLPVTEEVAVTASGLSDIEITALTIKIDYDDSPDRLKYVNFIPGGGWTFNHNDGSLTFIRVDYSGFTIDDGILFTLQFEYSGGNSSDFLDEMKANVTFGAGTIVQNKDFDFFAPELVNGWVALAIEMVASDEDVIIDDGGVDCFYSLYNLIVAGGDYEFIVESGGTATLAAGNSIRLLPGVKVEAGGYLHAFISDVDVCDDPGDKSDTAPDPLAVEEIEPVRTGEFFKLYPNPTTGSFTVELDQWTVDKVTVVEVFDLVGNRILAERAVSERQMVLSLSGRPTGMYIIRVSVDGEVGVERLIKR